MKRTVIKINEDLCTGCGLCVEGCHEGALQLIDGKARVVSDLYCDGLGACIGECPMHALELEERETEPYQGENREKSSRQQQWPIQMRLITPAAPCFQNADVILAADCVAFTYSNFHQRFLSNHPLVIACPKLDDKEGYVEKLTDLINETKINTLTVVMMEVPCCSGLLQLALKAQQIAIRHIPIKSIVISIQGEILKEEWL